MCYSAGFERRKETYCAAEVVNCEFDVVYDGHYFLL